MPINAANEHNGLDPIPVIAWLIQVGQFEPRLESRDYASADNLPAFHPTTSGADAPEIVHDDRPPVEVSYVQRDMPRQTNQRQEWNAFFDNKPLLLVA